MRRHVKLRGRTLPQPQNSIIWTGKKSNFNHAWDVSTERKSRGVKALYYITILSDTLFESQSGRHKTRHMPEIDIVADVVKKYPETDIIVDAHTDCIRSEEENLALSELQAWTLKKALVDKRRGGIPG